MANTTYFGGKNLAAIGTIFATALVLTGALIGVSGTFSPQVGQTFETATSTATFADPIAIDVIGSYAYVVTADSKKLQVIDVSNTSTPASVGSADLAEGARFVKVSGNYAYVSESAGANGILEVFDISDPATPRLAGSLSLTTSGFRGIYISGKYLYIGERELGNVAVVDISSPTNPTIVTQHAIDNVNACPHNMYVQGQYLYVTDNCLEQLDIFNISNPTVLATSSQLTLTEPDGIYVQGRYAYVTNQSASNMQVIDVSNPASPVVVSTTTVDTDPLELVGSGRYIYTANVTGNTVSVVDVSSSTAPVLINNIPVQEGPLTLAINGQFLYVINETSSTMSIINITGIETNGLTAHSAELGSLQVRSNAVIGNQLDVEGGMTIDGGGFKSNGASSIYSTSSPALSVIGGTNNLYSVGEDFTVVTSTYILSGYRPSDIFVDGQYAYFSSDGTGKLGIVDITNPLSPKVVTTTLTGTGDTVGVAVSGRYAYLSNEGASKKITVMDISNPGLPTIVTTTQILTGTGPEGMVISGKYLYTVASAYLEIIDISNPLVPVEVTGTFMGDASVLGLNIAKKDNYAFVPDITNNKVLIYDVSNPNIPSLVTSTFIGAGLSVIDVAVADRYMYVTNFDGDSMTVLDIKNIASPSIVATLALGTNAEPDDVKVAGQYAYVANSGNNTVSVIDISDPTTPTIIRNIPTGASTGPAYLDVSGNYLYTANTDGDNMSVINLKGEAVSALSAQSAQIGTLNNLGDAKVGNWLSVGDGLNVGSGGLLSTGALGVSATNTSSTFLGPLSVENLFSPSSMSVRALGGHSIFFGGTASDTSPMIFAPDINLTSAASSTLYLGFNDDLNMWVGSSSGAIPIFTGFDLNGNDIESIGAIASVEGFFTSTGVAMGGSAPTYFNKASVAVTDSFTPVFSFSGITTTTFSGVTSSTRGVYSNLPENTAALANVCIGANGYLFKDSTLACLTSNPKAKDHLMSLQNLGLKQVLGLKPMEWDWNSLADRTGHDFGFNAEQAATVDERLIARDENGEIKGFRYTEYVAVLTKAIQEEQKEIDELKQAIKSCKH